MNNTVSSLIAIHDAKTFAIGAPDRELMTYGGLRDLSENVTKLLHGSASGAVIGLRLFCPMVQRWQRLL